jgi:aspartate/glutamate racemase
LTTVGFLHTASSHVPAFEALLAQVAPGVDGVHVVDEALLADAATQGLDAGLLARLEGRLRELAQHAPGVIVCTCSTFSGHAERLSQQLGVRVLRIDRPLAERAVAHGGRIALVAAVSSTLAPTRALFEECATARGSAAVLVDAPCLEAWALFQRGEHAAYYAAIARHVRDIAGVVDVVVLAQASMAPAADLLPDLAIPVLTSPVLAVRRAVEIAEVGQPMAQ